MTAKLVYDRDLYSRAVAAPDTVGITATSECAAFIAELEKAAIPAAS
jgi:hypothetical protein